ncbi:MAG: hypothetical protein AMS27_05865 [Bacteroides sp. SM23_62_1]|nr:MAG: hypothetical protein AMS27_05865 [Bacteroides sp. SM23_62_1]
MKVYILTFLLLTVCVISGSAQPGSNFTNQPDIYQRLFTNRTGAGDIKIVRDQKLDEIFMEYLEINRHRNGIPCYWIRIYSGSGHDARERAYQAKAKFLKKYEGIKDKVLYDDPNFKVYVGGYRIKSDALKLLKLIQKDFPTSFIVYDIIDFPDVQTPNISKD